MDWNKMIPELIVTDFKTSLDFYTRVPFEAVKCGDPFRMP